MKYFISIALSPEQYCIGINHTSWVAVVTPTDRPKSVRNRCVIELFCGVVCVVTLPFWHFCWCRSFCHRTESDLFLFLFALTEWVTKWSKEYFISIALHSIALAHLHVIFNTNKILMQYFILLVLHYSIALASFFCLGTCQVKMTCINANKKKNRVITFHLFQFYLFSKLQVWISFILQSEF